jgi:hypothetical protein
MHSLSLLSSRRMRLLYLAEFVEPLLSSTGSRYLAAYVHELTPLVTGAVLQADFIGTSSTFERRILRLMDDITVLFPDVAETPGWKQAQNALSVQLTKSLEWLNGKEVASLSEWSGRSDTVWVPFVERERLLKNSPLMFGTPLRMGVAVSVSGERAGEDEIRMGEFDTAEPIHPDHLTAALKAAKQLALVVAPHGRVPSFKVSCTIDSPGVLEGESLLCGFAAAALCGILQALEHKEEYAFREDVAITGRINEKGEILPVEESGLRTKVEACLYSPVRVLVVPKEQEDLCSMHLTSVAVHADRPPGRQGSHLRIIGAFTLADVFNNRLLIASHTTPAITRIARKAWKRRRPLAAILFFGMAVAIGRLLYGPIDKIPVGGHFGASELILENESGQSLVELPVGKRGVAVGTIALSGRTGAFAIVPIKEDRETDYRCFYPAADSVGSLFEIRCWSSKRREILWRHPLDVVLKFPLHPTPEEKAFTVRQLVAGDFARDGSTNVIVAATGSGFGSIVVMLDGLTGATRGLYAHPGHLASMATMDFDDDGISEICLCGMNNAYDNQACLVVLDPRSLSGYGPVRDEYALEGLAPAHHRAYVLIPPTIVGGAFHRKQGTTSAVSVFMSQDGRKALQIQVVDINLLDKDCFATTVANYYLTFNARLEPVSMLTANDYDKLAENLFEDGKIAFLPKKNPRYQDDFFKTLLYWDGTGWEHHTTLTPAPGPK